MPERRLSPVAYLQSLPLLKQLFWLYFLLWIFEGALRKWIFPQYSAPLLLVRDPVAVLIIVESLRTGKWPERWSALTGALFAGLFGLCLIQIVVGGNHWIAAIYGLRSYLLPFPVAFIMGDNLNREDLRRFGTCTLWLSLPMTLLEVAQYLSPPGSILNAGASQGAEQIVFSGDHTRASATFSFVTGTSSFGPLAAAFLLYGIVTEKFTQQLLIWASAFALILSIPVTGSRTLVFELAGTIGCAAIAALSGISQLFKMLRIAIPLLVMASLVSFLPVFLQASRTLGDRFQEASASEGSVSHALLERTIGTILPRLQSLDFTSNPLGIGMGEGAAAITKLTTGQATFVAGEDEISRELIEFGPYAGTAFVFFHFSFAAFIVLKSLARSREQAPLALLFLPLVVPGLTVSAIEQPTAQGILVIALTFTLVALKREPVTIRPVVSPVSAPRVARYTDAIR